MLTVFQSKILVDWGRRANSTRPFSALQPKRVFDACKTDETRGLCAYNMTEDHELRGNRPARQRGVQVASLEQDHDPAHG